MWLEKVPSHRIEIHKMNTVNTLSTALAWWSKGISTIPLPLHSKKKPLIKWRQYQKRLPSIKEMLKWYKRDSNIAIICGWRGLVILDFDDMSAYPKWLKSHINYADTYTIETGRGKHLYYYVKNYISETKGLKTKEAEIRCNNYCLVPPSIHPNGKRYEVINDSKIRVIQNVSEIALPLPSMGGGASKDKAVSIPPHTRQSLSGSSPIIAIKNSFLITDLFPRCYPSGDHYAIAHCPSKSHSNGDRNPSLSLDLETNRCQCLKPGCPLNTPHGNDVIDAYAILNNLSLRQAIVQMLRNKK